MDKESSAAAPTRFRNGVWFSLSAYGLWGLFPLYFKALAVAPLEFLLHRVVWSAALLAGVISAQRAWGTFLAALRVRGARASSFASACLLSVNWFVYIWAVTSNRVVDASLGYFINPLFSVLMGVALLGERLRRLQLLSILTAAAGVLWLTLQFGELPWVGLTLAASFGTYGVLRKTAALGSFEGLALEQLLLLPFAVIGLSWLALHGQSAFVLGGVRERVLLLGAGPLTVLPLLLFAAGARRIPLSLLGVLQYVAPTLQLLLGVFLWHEPFGTGKVLGYACIWLGLLLYAADGLWVSRVAGSTAAMARHHRPEG